MAQQGASAIERLAAFGAGLKLQAVPERVRIHARAQLLSALAALHAGYASDLGPLAARAFPAGPAGGPAAVLPSRRRADPQPAAVTMAAWCVALDYDDTLLGGHTAPSCAMVPLAYTAALGRSGHCLLLAQITATEIASRIGMALSLGPLRGQLASHLHLAGAAAARAKLEGADAGEFADALALALAYPIRGLTPALIGSTAKLGNAAGAVRAGLEALDGVRAGLRAPRDLLEAPHGLLEALCEAPSPLFLDGLGERWHTETNAYKRFPCVAYNHAAIEAAIEVSRSCAFAPEMVERVQLRASIFTVQTELHVAPYRCGPDTPLPALAFSVGFGIACALSDGRFGTEHLRLERRRDPALWRLAERVEVELDVALSAAALRSDLPLGAALRRLSPLRAARFLAHASRGRARTRGLRGRWQRARIALAAARAAGLREPLASEGMRKELGARLCVWLRDGRRIRREVRVPIGFPGSSFDPQALAREKFERAAAENVGVERARLAAELALKIEFLSPTELHHFAALNCAGDPCPRRD